MTNEDNSLLLSSFYNNVRDYHGSNDVNKEIKITIKSYGKNIFDIVNNGITLAAKNNSIKTLIHNKRLSNNK